MESLYPGVPILGLDELRAQALHGLLPRYQPSQSFYDTDRLTIIEEDCTAIETSSPEVAGHRSPSRLLCPTESDRHVQRTPRETVILQRHLAGLFDWILTIQLDLDPGHQGQGTYSTTLRYYGCSVVKKLRNPGDKNSCGEHKNLYKLFATPLRPNASSVDSRLDDPSDDMALSEPIVRLTTPPTDGTGDGDVVDLHIPSVTEAPEYNAGPLITASDQMTFALSAASSSQGRIEDSVEALDKLEDDLEALHSASHVRKLNSLQERGPLPAVDDRLSTSVTRGDRMGLDPKSASVRVKSRVVRPSIRRSTSLNLGVDKGLTVQRATDAPPVRRNPALTRPSNQNSPSCPAKSTNPPNKTTCELPGEAVSRNPKEQREARRAGQATSGNPPSTTFQRSKSMRAPTIPRFELPGEAISRRKKEQHERQLREQAEEERRRREFKAAPIRSTIAPATYPRETAASRARRVKAVGDENQEPVRQAAPATPAAKRASVHGLISRPSLRKSASTISSASTASTSSRGRATVGEDSHTSRETSASVSSASANRKPISHEDVERQRIRGKEIYDQDNSYAASREYERRQREMAAKAARDQANERSRQQARQWEERKLRRQSAVMGGNPVVPS